MEFFPFRKRRSLLRAVPEALELARACANAVCGVEVRVVTLPPRVTVTSRLKCRCQ